MPNGDESGKPGDKIEPHHRNNGNEGGVNHKHVLVAQGKHHGPDKKKRKKQGKDGSVKACEKGALLLFICGKKITRGQPLI